MYHHTLYFVFKAAACAVGVAFGADAAFLHVGLASLAVTPLVAWIDYTIANA